MKRKKAVNGPGEICKWYNRAVKSLSAKLWHPTESINMQHQVINGISFDNAANPGASPEISFIAAPSLDTSADKAKILEKYNKDNDKMESNEDLKNKTTRQSELKTKKDKALSRVGKIIKAQMFQIKLRADQHIIMQKWLRACERVYNKCVEMYNLDASAFSLNYKVSKLVVFGILYGESEKDAPYDMLTDEVRAFCSNVKSCLSNRANGNISAFKMKPKNTMSSQCVLIPKKSISPKGIFPILLGAIPEFSKIITAGAIECDARLNYDRLFGRYFLYIPQYCEQQHIENRKPVVALDPGERVFQTYYSPDDCGKIGANMREVILGNEKKIAKYQRALKSGTNKRKKKLRNKKKMKQKLNACYRDIKNKVKELHNQACNFLCKTYDTIIIPEFKTQGMVKCDRKKTIIETVNKIKETSENVKDSLRQYTKKNRLTGRVKFVLNMQSHYRFRQQLLNKSKEYGCRVIVMTEEYTSQCCGNCGALSNQYINRVKHCENCKFQIDRDLNGARNILLKTHKDILRL